MRLEYVSHHVQMMNLLLLWTQELAWTPQWKVNMYRPIFLVWLLVLQMSRRKWLAKAWADLGFFSRTGLSGPYRVASYYF